jgi:hypothetical protein
MDVVLSHFQILYFFVDCTSCNRQVFQYFDFCHTDVEESTFNTFISKLRKRYDFSLLDSTCHITMPARISLLISELRDDYMEMPNEFRKRWITIDDLKNFTIRENEIMGEINQAKFGTILEGRFEGCISCNKCRFGLWSCNIGINDHKDKNALIAVTRDLDKKLFPLATDEKKSVVARISKSKYLDDIVVYYPQYSVLNESLTSHQPKRRSEGIVKKSVHTFQGIDGEGQGKRIISLPNYTSYGRYQDNWQGRPMKLSTFIASLISWRACWIYLTEVSRKSPPTHCQMLFYYGALKSKMGHHRDNFNVQFIKDILSGKDVKMDGHPSGGGENSQIVGSNVLVLTMGNKPMKFSFRFPSFGNLKGNRKTYITSPKHQFTCGKLTISVLDPIDDIVMTHGANFVYNTREDKNDWLRIGYCFRWLQSFRDFYEDSCTLRLDSASLLRKRCNKISNRDIYT